MKRQRDTQQVKEQDKCLPNQIKEEEIGNLPDKESQIMIVKMIQNLEIKMESDIINDLGADSLDVVEMIMGVETEFNVTVPDEVAMEMKTIGDVVAFIEKNQ